jgi:hypothetical protein
LTVTARVRREARVDSWDGNDTQDRHVQPREF